MSLNPVTDSNDDLRAEPDELPADLPLPDDEVEAEYIKDFLVVGGRHHTPWHTFLARAFKHYNGNTFLARAFKHYNGKNPIDVYLYPEPDNPKDPNAILVKLNYAGEYVPVCYIQKDMTKYLLPLIKNRVQLAIEITKMKFGVSRPIGYEIDIRITKRGRWI